MMAAATTGTVGSRRAPWAGPAAVFLAVVVTQLVLVAVAGTDIPFQDQWDIEGRWLFPTWIGGGLRATDLFRAFNEHRIVWTHLLNLGLFAANGQWDPLVELAAIAVLRAGLAAGLAWLLGRGLTGRGRIAVAAGVAVAFLPHLAWQNVLWGIESHTYFVLGFSVIALAALGAEDRPGRRTLGGLVAGGAALLAMGAGAFVPVALLGLATVRAIERRRVAGAGGRDVWPALVLLAAALALRVEVPEHAVLRAATPGEFLNAFGRALAWPHGGQPLAAVAMNLPLALAVAGRVAGRRRAARGEDFVLLLGGWAVAAAGAMAWTRGGGHEFDGGVPSRYVDFLVLLPLANAWCAVALAGEATAGGRRVARVAAGAWGIFLFVGWLGLSAEVMQRLILPRMRDRDAPVRLAVAFQHGGDPAVFAGQPLLLVPHPDPGSVRAVLTDPRMQGVLPPSFQPGRPVGPLSRAVRTLLGRQ